MVDWRILAGGIIILLVAGFVVFGGTNTSFLSDSIDRLKELFSDSPLGDLFSFGPDETSEATVTFYPDAFTLSSTVPTDIALGEARFTAFEGTVAVDFPGDAIILTEDSGLRVTSPVVDTEFTDFRFKNIILENMHLEVVSGDWTMISENGSVEIRDFSGMAFINADNQSISFVGNVSLVEQR